ncbi:MAG: DUF2752 domain-containing protein [Clostridia bacterium]|nr:DUF2752 domain-containing protein [Clostridia bacterium]
MKKFFKLKWIIIIADIVIIPGILLCKWLTDVMLSTDTTCVMVTLGGQCVTCGGTHFVNTFASGKFIEAFDHNQFLFLLTIFFAVTLLFLNLYLLFGLKFAKKVLLFMYNIPSLIIWLSVMLVFFILRNIPVFIRAYETIASIVKSI